MNGLEVLCFYRKLERLLRGKCVELNYSTHSDNICARRESTKLM
jgi:hypothetical protein